MSLRGIELVHRDTGSIVTPEHTIGVDETGTFNDEDPFAIAAVLCPREVEVHLAERMIDAGMNIWKEKPSEKIFAASDLSSFIDSHPDISWFAIGATGSITRQQKAAAAVTAAAYTLIQPNASWTYSADKIALVHDGGDNMYGNAQFHLRKQALTTFDYDFTSSFGEVFLTQTPRGDQIYPSVMIADLISGQVCEQIQKRSSLSDVNNYGWFRESWVEGAKGELPKLYYLNAIGSDYEEYLWENYAAWLFGKAASDTTSHRESLPVERLARRIDSPVITEYLGRYY